MKRIVPGIHSVREALKTRPEAITEIWIKDERLHDDLLDLEELARKHKVKIQKFGLKRLDQVVGSHQGIIAYLNDGPSWPDAKRLEESRQGIVLVCDGLEDPHNMGSLMRTAWNLGVVGVIYSKDRSAGASPAAQKVASGAFEHVPLMEASNIVAEIKSLKDLGFWVYGLEEEASRKIFETDLTGKVILVVGSEEKGLRKPTRDVCDDFLSIPSTRSSSSLNVAVAGGIAIFEAKRQVLTLAGSRSTSLAKNIENSRKKL